MDKKVDKILECYRRIQEEMGAGAVGGAGIPTNNASSGAIAGLPPDDPPVDFRKRKYKKLNMFYRQAVKPSKGAKNGRKGS